MQTPWRSLVGPLALKHGVDAYLVEAVIWVESRGHADAFRYEPAYHKRYIANHPDYQHENGRRFASAYGLMQLLPLTARELGWLGEPEDLFGVRLNISLGCQLLKKLLDWAATHPNTTPEQQLKAAVASYRCGKGGNRPDQPLRPDCAAYAERVLAAAQAMREPD